jgi:hypothetical protein
MLLTLLLLVQPPAMVRAEFAPLPTEWHGNWQGTLKITNGQKNQEVAFKLEIKPISDSRVTWHITYGEGDKAQTRLYELVALSKKPGYFELDEKSGIRMQERLLGNKLYCLFRVSNSLLHTKHELVGDVIHYEISTFAEKEPLKTAFEKNQQIAVDSWQLLSIQSAELKRVK